MTTTSKTFKANRKYPAIPTIVGTVESHQNALRLIAECIAIHERRTNDLDNSFVRVSELIDLGLITLNVDGSFNAIGVDLGDIADVDIATVDDGDVLTWDETIGGWIAAPPVGVTDHGALTGLGDNDHPQYGLLTGDNLWTGINDLSGPLEADGDEGISGQVLSSQGAGLPPVWRSSSGGSIELGYNFTTVTTATDPGSQKLGFNTALYTTITEIRFDVLAFTNFDASTILSLLREGNRIYIQQRNDASKAFVVEVTGLGTNMTGWWSIPVTHINSIGTIFPNNADLNCVFILSSHAGVGELDDLTDVDTTGVADGDVLTYDAGAGEWVAAAPTGGGGGDGYPPQLGYAGIT